MNDKVTEQEIKKCQAVQLLWYGKLGKAKSRPKSVGL